MENSKFSFVDRNLDGEKATFSYKVDINSEVFEFEERLFFPSGGEEMSRKLLEKILDDLHLVLGISYYKLFCPKNLDLGNITLSKDQAEFWNTVYTKGLGEFFYKNNIDFRGLIKFPYKDGSVVSPIVFPRENRSLVGIGGGKDSIVAGELLKKAEKEFRAFTVNSHPIMDQSIQLLGVESITVKRSIDPLLFELNKRSDTYNGHVPVSAQNAFIGLLTALLFDYNNIVMANEQSANYGNVEYLGEEINHQWSKSYEFEKMFQQYVKTYITPDVFYFSLLRPFSELKITEIFAKHPKYFPVFSSCNRNFRIAADTDKRWCGECPKCAFTFLMLSAFLPKDKTLEIFGQNLFANEALLQTYKELLGIADTKPFDCVGTPEEVQVALYLASQKKEYENDAIMKFFQNELLPTIKNIDKLKEKVLELSENHNIPEEFKKALNV